MSPFSPTSGNKDRHQARFKRTDEFTIGSEKARQSRPDIVIIENTAVEAPLGPYAPQALKGPDELMSTILRDLQPRNVMLQNLLVWKKKKRWAPDRTEGMPFTKRRATFILTKPRSADRKGGISRKWHKRNPWRKFSRRLKRSLSSLHGTENNLEDRFGSNRLKSQEQKRRESRKAAILRKRRGIEMTITPDSSRHIQLSALKTQMKLSQIVEQLANPSSHLTEPEKLAYMRELLHELKLFIKLLQQQMNINSKEKLIHLAKSSPLLSQRAS